MKVNKHFILPGLMLGLTPLVVGAYEYMRTWNPIWAAVAVVGIPLMFLFPHFLDKVENAQSQK